MGLVTRKRVVDHHHHHSRSTLIILEAHHFGLPIYAELPRAAMGLAVSALTGWKMDQRFPDSGIIVSLLLSGFLSNKARLVPTSSPLYDLCWTLFLPASLALLLLSMNKTTTTTKDKKNSILQQGNEEYSIAKSVRRVFIPFIIASFGSVLGCLFSFVLCHSVAPPTFHLQHSNNNPLLLPLTEARIALSCLTASFIGGSVNFFATANQIATAASSSSASSSSSMTIVSSMAAADIIVMLMYFTLLGAALQSKTMKRWFVGSNNTSVTSKVVVKEEAEDGDDPIVPIMQTATTTATTLQPKPVHILSVINSATLASTLVFVIVRIASRIEQLLADFVPGLACAVIVAIVPLLKRCVNQFLSWLPYPKQEPSSSSSAVITMAERARCTWLQIQDIAEPLSQIAFFMLFASIGVSANLAGAVRSGPACLFLSMVAMIVHLVVTISVSLLVRWRGLFWFLPFTRIRKATTSRRTAGTTTSSIRLEDVLIASNAAIGGPATAAAFCSRIRGPGQKGLTYAAVVWGVFGYAIGTTIGVLFHRFLGYAFQMM